MKKVYYLVRNSEDNLLLPHEEESPEMGCFYIDNDLDKEFSFSAVWGEDSVDFTFTLGTSDVIRVVIPNIGVCEFRVVKETAPYVGGKQELRGKTLSRIVPCNQQALNDLCEQHGLYFVGVSR